MLSEGLDLRAYVCIYTCPHLTIYGHIIMLEAVQNIGGKQVNLTNWPLEK